MNERIILISLFNQEMIHQIIKSKDLCKVPFGKNVKNRIKVDTLPYHFTISTWSIQKKLEVEEKLKSLQFNKFTIKIDNISVMKGKENSYVLYFTIEKNKELTKLQEKIYQVLPNQYYNPQTFENHITIHIDKDYKKILKIKNHLEKKFQPFELEVNSLGLYTIYPAHKVKIINCSTN